MRAILRGLLVGALLSWARAPLGLDLFQWPAVGGRTAYAWRSAAVLAAAIGLFRARQVSLPVRLLLGVAVGFGLHALLLANWGSPSGMSALATAILVALVLLRVLRAGPAEAAEDAAAPKLLELVGLAAAAAGAAIACEGVARHVRLLGCALAQDDAVFACVFLGLVIAGGAAFGWATAARGLRGLSLPAGLAASAAAGFVSIVVLRRLSVEESYAKYLHLYGLDPSLRGTLAYDALIAAACFVAPGLLLGAALLGAHGRKRVFAVLVGGALGLSLLPGLLAIAPGSTTADVQPSSTELVPLGLLVAAGGALVAILSLSDRRAFARWAGIAVVLLLAMPALLVQTKPVHVLSPWATRQTFPLMVTDAPEGLLTVESYGLLDGSWAFATLDRRTLTPPGEENAADEMRLRGSFDLLPPDRRAAGGIRVLLVGQLTPQRARVMADCGATRIDRTAAWHAAMERMEGVFWSQLPPEEARPAGSILAPAAARRSLDAGEYDLVIVPCVPGDAPRTRAVEVPPATTVVRWLGIDEPAASRDLGTSVAFTADGFDLPAVALLTHAAPAEGSGELAPLLLAAGEPRSAPTPWSWLGRRKSERGDDRADRSRAALMERLAEAARGGASEDLAAGLAAFYSAQEHSSQFESPEERTELPAAALARFRSAALAGPPGPFLRRTWDRLARILVRKRWVEETYTYAQPVAAAHHPWPSLEVALAQADLESLEPKDALARLEPLVAAGEIRFDLFELLGRVQCALGSSEKALEAWKRAVELPTSDRRARKKVILAVARTGDPVGIAGARQLLLESPTDTELRAVLMKPVGSGPAPDPCSP
jgi:hypothetical protein